MATVLIKNATLLATFDDARREIAGGGLLIRDNVIEQVGARDALPTEADRVIDLSGHVVLPGLVNTHHHFYQNLTRACAQDAHLFTWLKTLFGVWTRLTDEAIHVSTQVAIAELIRSGCTTSSDHLYLFPNDVRLDTQIRVAAETGIRFHAARGAMSLGESAGGLPPDSLTEDEADILADSQRLIETYHDNARHAMLRIVLAPCSPFSVTPALMRETAALARSHRGVRLHTHLAETLDEERFCLERFGKRPIELAESLGWMGEDVWFAHCVHMHAPEIARFAAAGSGIAHCPTSNMRLGSGIAPLAEWCRAGVRVGLGVDGSASNDGSHLLGEARMAMLLQRVAPARDGTGNASATRAGDPMRFSARQALEVATRGGAAVLGRDDIGQIAKGMSADIVALDLNRIDYAGAHHDPLAAVVFCQPRGVDFAMIDGKIVLEKREFTQFDPAPIVIRHNRIARDMLG